MAWEAVLVDGTHRTSADNAYIDLPRGELASFGVPGAMMALDGPPEQFFYRLRTRVSLDRPGVSQSSHLFGYTTGPVVRVGVETQKVETFPSLALAGEAPPEPIVGSGESW